jgi:hypothetical protein
MPSELPDSFNCGPFVTARNPDVGLFVDKLNRLREAVDACRIQPGVGYTLTRSSGGTTLTIRDSSGVAEQTQHPFKLKVRKNGDAYEFWATQGQVGNGEVQTSNMEKWVSFKAPARIYIEAQITDLSVTSIELKTKTPTEVLKRTEIQGGKQAYARISVGLYVEATTGKKDYQVVQNVRTDIMSQLLCYNGYPALVLTQEGISTA